MVRDRMRAHQFKLNGLLVLPVLFILNILPLGLSAQDSLVLRCPVNEKLDAPAPRKSYSIGAEDLKAAWTCNADTTVKACIDGLVTVVLHDADGKWELMYRHEDLTFWYSGLFRLTVSQGQKIKTGDTIGFVRKAGKLSLQMMDAESSVDPKPFLDCTK